MHYGKSTAGSDKLCSSKKKGDKLWPTKTNSADTDDNSGNNCDDHIDCHTKQSHDSYDGMIMMMRLVATLASKIILLTPPTLGSVSNSVHATSHT